MNEQATQVDLISPEVIEAQSAGAGDIPSDTDLPAANDVPVLESEAGAVSNNDIPEIVDDVPAAGAESADDVPQIDNQ